MIAPIHFLPSIYNFIQTIKPFAAWTRNYYDVAKQSFFYGMGVDEFYRQGVSAHDVLIAEKRGLVDKVDKVVLEKMDFKLKTAERHIIRGMMYLVSGSFGTYNAIHKVNGLPITPQIQLIDRICDGTFLIANLLSIEYCIRQYWESQEMIKEANSKELLETARRSSDSAVLGIVSSLGYIASTAIFYLTGAAFIAFFLGCLATWTNALKVLIDCCYLP